MFFPSLSNLHDSDKGVANVHGSGFSVLVGIVVEVVFTVVGFEVVGTVVVSGVVVGGVVIVGVVVGEVVVGIAVVVKA